MSPTAAGEGVYCLRLTGGGMAAVYPVACLGGTLSLGRSAPQIPVPGAAGSAKRGSDPGNDLEISKPGYRTQVYRTVNDTSSFAYVTLAAAGDTGEQVAFSDVIRVSSIDRPGHFLYTARDRITCNGSAPTVEQRIDTVYYTVEAGRLWISIQNWCGGNVLKGASNDIIGSWTWDATYQEFPPQFRRPGCLQHPIQLLSPDEEATEAYLISDADIRTGWTADYCAGDDFRMRFDYPFSADTSVHMTENTCGRYRYRNGAGESATVLMTNVGDSTFADFASGLKSCHMGLPHSTTADSPRICPKPVSPYAAFTACEQKSGFAKSGPGLPKRSAAEAAAARAVGPFRAF